jgi:hypothetical protein
MNEIRPPITGTLDASGVVILAASRLITMPPYSLTLKSADAGRKIEISTDGGTEYVEGIYDINTGTMLMIGILTPITHIRFTGVQGDTWRAA